MVHDCASLSRSMYQAIESVPGYHSVFMHSQPSGLLRNPSQHSAFPSDFQSKGEFCIQADRREDFFGEWKAIVLFGEGCGTLAISFGWEMLLAHL